jgi:hypothetical protein
MSARVSFHARFESIFRFPFPSESEALRLLDPMDRSPREVGRDGPNAREANSLRLKADGEIYFWLEQRVLAPG